MSNVVTASAYLTLHYRLASMDGTNIVSTFEGNPATLMLGQGQLAPNLEALLIGLPEGTHKVFELAAGEGFGPRNPAWCKPCPVLRWKKIPPRTMNTRSATWSTSTHPKAAASPACCANCAMTLPSSISITRWLASR